MSKQHALRAEPPALLLDLMQLLVLHTRVSMINQTSITSNATLTLDWHGAAGLNPCTGHLLLW